MGGPRGSILTLEDDDTSLSAGDEIETVRRLRRHLLEDEGLSRDQVRAAGYWRIGEAGSRAKLDD